jgi:glycosyltransferase involved in cell wall biosynthesis
VARQFSNVVIVERDGQLRYELTDVPDVLGSLDAEYTPRYSAVLGEEVPLSARDRELLVHERTYCHDAVIAAILRLHHALDHYVLLTEYVWMTRLLPLIDDRAVKVVDTIDVFSTKPAKVLRFGIQDLWMEPGEEAARLKRADLVVAIQDDERRALQHLVPDRQVVTAGIDFEVSGVARLPDAPRLLYVGSANPLNVRGLRDFLRFAWPIVKQQVPDAELIVAGAVAESVREPLPGVKLLGSVERLDGLYASCRVAINPAIAGTGLKIKSVESLCRLRPLVTWPAGVDGLPTELRPLCDVAEDWYDFGVRVVRRLVTRGGDAFSEAERRAIEQSTSSQAVYAALVGALQQRLAQHASAAGPRSGT